MSDMIFSLSRLNVVDQLCYDPLKVVALCEKVIMALAMIMTTFYLLKLSGLANEFLLGAALSGTVGFLAFLLKKMYYDYAFSQLDLPIDIEFSAIEKSLFDRGFIKDENGDYLNKKTKFSILHKCKSEKIYIQTDNKNLTFRGPYEDLEVILNLIYK
ncbi:hypothetical protein ACIQUF_13195 [Pseudomonas sp. NPDC090233]|uniref:hypothetical protein n=1 Tax=Pseudomonas sp. NPDC090233 TaxID=3364479 RepID=UPI00383A13D1